MSFKGVNMSKGDGSLGARPASDMNIHGIVFGGVVAPGYSTLGTSVKLMKKEDADTLGFTTAFDAANKVLIRYHINEYYRINPYGTLWIMVVAQATTMTNMCNVANAFVKKLINDSGKTIKAWGVVRNPAAGYTPTLTGGFDGDVLTAVPMAQALCDDFTTKNVYIDACIIEGREMNGTFAATNLRTLASPNVRVVVAQDKDVASLDALYAKTAAVGTYLGSHGVRRPEEDEGSINSENNPKLGQVTMPVNDAGLGLWVNPALSNGNLVKDLSPSETALLNTNAYLHIDSYPEFAGQYWNGSHACTLLSSDYAYGVNTRVWNFAARIATRKLTPKFKSKVETDDNGYISTIAASEWQEDVNNQDDGLGSMVSDRYALKSAVYLNPKQSIYTNSTVDVDMTVKPWGYAREINGKLSMSKN